MALAIAEDRITAKIADFEGRSPKNIQNSVFFI